MDSIEDALLIALDAHKDQKYGDKEYIWHVLKVASYSVGEKDLIVALLHDVIEDSDYTAEDLSKHFSKEVVDAVVAISRVEGEAKAKYTKRVKGNTLALQVKVFDVLSNREACIAEGNIKRANKYDKLLEDLGY